MSDQEVVEMDEAERPGARRRVQNAYKRMGEQIGEARDRSKPLDTALTHGSRGVGKAKDVTIRVAGKADELVGNQTGKLTLADYRAEVDAALDEALEVIAAQQAEIEILRGQVQRLESDQR